MKNSLVVIVLVLVCLGLGVAVVVIKKQSTDQHAQDTQQIGTLSNNWTKVSSELEEQKQVSTNLEKDLEAKKQEFQKSVTELTNNIAQVSANLAKTETELKAAEQKVKEQDTKIADLENQNQALDKKAESLSASITNLNTQIADTRHKLAAAEGDKAFLEQRLKDLTAEKTELERQFNDLSILRAQVAKLKSEAAIARRIEWSRMGIFAANEEKGAQKLMQGVNRATPRNAGRPNYDLNVEVNADGSVRVLPPSTNSPANRPVTK